jgi:ATP-dependent protease ClpP protease subunit
MPKPDEEETGLEANGMGDQGLYSYLAKRVANKDWFTFWGDVADGPCELCSLFLLDALSRKTPIVTLVICSPGGEEDDMRGLIGIMEYCKQQGMILRGYAVGIVASAAFDMLIACSPGYRFAFELTMFMTHSSAGHVEDEDMYKLNRRFDRWTLKKYTNIHSSTLKKFLKTGNWWFDAKDAIGYGAIDGVLGIGDPLPDRPVFPKRKSVEEQMREAALGHEDSDEET